MNNPRELVPDIERVQKQVREVSSIERRKQSDISSFLLKAADAAAEADTAWMLEELTEYNDGGANLPNLYVVLGKRVIDLSGLSSDTQIYSLGNVELAGCGAQEPLIVAATKRVDA